MVDETRRGLESGAAKARQGIDDVAGAAKSTLDTASSAAAASLTRLDEAGKQAWDLGQRYGSQAQRRAREMTDMVADTANRGVRLTRKQVRSEPFLSMLVAGAVGYGLALLLHRR